MEGRRIPRPLSAGEPNRLLRPLRLLLIVGALMEVSFASNRVVHSLAWLCVGSDTHTLAYSLTATIPTANPPTPHTGASERLQQHRREQEQQ